VRISRAALYMAMAQLLAMRGTCTRARVGAVVVKDGRVISTGYVGSPSGTPHCIDVGCEIGPGGGCIRTVHAEANAIAFAAKYGIALEGSTMYCTLSSCRKCAELIINSGIKEVVYLNEYRDMAGPDLLEKAGVTVRFLVKGEKVNELLEEVMEEDTEQGLSEMPAE